MKKYFIIFIFFPVILLSSVYLFLLSCSEQEPLPDIYHAQGEMAGEVTQTSVILQSRLTASDTPVEGDVPGCHGMACFELSTVPDFPHYLRTSWMKAVPEKDYIIKTKVTGLNSGTRYYYRLVYSAQDDSTVYRGDVCTFRTLSDSTVADEVSFVVVTGMNYAKFHHGRPNIPETAYQGSDKSLGYPALETILSMEPDFFVGTGDNVYYDHPVDTRAKTVSEMRRKWREQYVQKRFKKLFARVSTYWEKDDHDYRYNDADTTGIPDGSKPSDTEAPSHELGIATFIEQVPVADPHEPGSKTYRTYRINKLLQIWLTEGRDYRSPNSMPNGPEKSLWGKEQKVWLKKTLLASNAPFKILVSPTPMVGPDDAYKSDNHVNQKGFRHEGEEFFRWLKDNDFLNGNFYIVCGDRHWQYHSIHPSGFEEFSCGALVDANSRLGRKPSDPKSTDPDGLVKQPYTSVEPSGGFLKVSIRPGDTEKIIATAEFTFYDEKGTILYSATKKQRE